jgi:F0F1-type ATP synthase delta subunit
MSGGRFQATVLDALAENGRLGRTTGVIDAYGQIMSAHRGEVQGVVTAAKVNYISC